jgi:zinc protease
MKKQIFLFTLILIFASFAAAQEKETKTEKTEKPKVEKKEKLPSAKKIFKKHVKGSGGRKTAKKIKSRITTGTVEIPAMGLKGTFEMLSKAPNKSLVSMNLSGLGEITEAFDGSQAWANNPLQGLRVKTGKELEEVKEATDFYYDFNLDKIYPNAAVSELKNIDGAEVYIVKADEDTTLYFDKQSGLLTRVDQVVTSPEGKINSVTKFEDFRVVDGIRQTFRFRQSALGAEFVFNVSEIKQNVEIADERFSKPE